MHPVIRIITFLIIVIYLPYASRLELLVTGGLLLIFAVFLDKSIILRSLNFIYRLRWLFLSIFILYGWFTPGDSVLNDTVTSWLPGMTGLVEAATRIGSLMLVVLAVNIILYVTPRQALFEAIYWLVRPLGYFGISYQSFALRLFLVMELIEQRDIITINKTGFMNSGRGFLNRAGNMVAEVFSSTISRADQQQPVTLTISDISNPPLIHWAYPVALLLLIYGVSLIG
jgi:energy-coupling factor transporter transmembrane protein EcfT